MSKEIKKAVEKLQKALNKDKDYYHSWQANIAMAFYDEYRRRPKKYINRQELLEISNNAAKNFLNLLIKWGGLNV